MSAQGNIAPGSGTRVSTAVLARRIVLTGVQDPSTGNFSILGIGRVTVTVIQDLGAPGASAKLFLAIQGSQAGGDLVDETAILALGTPYQVGGHIGGSEIRIEIDGGQPGDQYTVLIQATGTS